jgi:hypothetical protein
MFSLPKVGSQSSPMISKFSPERRLDEPKKHKTLFLKVKIDDTNNLQAGNSEIGVGLNSCLIFPRIMIGRYSNKQMGAVSALWSNWVCIKSALTCISIMYPILTTCVSTKSPYFPLFTCVESKKSTFYDFGSCLAVPLQFLNYRNPLTS